MQRSPVQCSVVRCGAVRCGSAVQCSAVQCSAAQCSAVQCSAVQCSAVRCGAARRGAFQQACVHLDQGSIFPALTGPGRYEKTGIGGSFSIGMCCVLGCAISAPDLSRSSSWGLTSALAFVPNLFGRLQPSGLQVESRQGKAKLVGVINLAASSAPSRAAATSLANAEATSLGCTEAITLSEFAKQSQFETFALSVFTRTLAKSISLHCGHSSCERLLCLWRGWRSN